MIEWKKLISVSDVQYGFPFDSTLFTEDKRYIPLIRIRDIKPAKASTYYSGDYSNDYIIKKGDILVGMDGEFNLEKWDDRDGLLNQRVLKITGKKDICLNEYIYHYMSPVFKDIEKKTAGGSVKHLSAKVINTLKIPIPSKEEQARIVSILDTFTDSIANLDAQIKARRKQYEYYRDQLLDLEGKDGVEMKILKDLAIIMNGKDYKKLSDGNIPVYGTGGIMAYVDTFAYDKPSVLLPRKGSVEKIYYVTNPFWTVDTIYWTIIKTEIILPKFLYHALCKYDLKDYSYGGGIPSLSQKILYGLTIPLPSLQEQSRIVSILDQFEESIKNLEAQYELRKKQYEYYRNQLLNFDDAKELAANTSKSMEQSGVSLYFNKYILNKK